MNDARSYAMRGRRLSVVSKALARIAVCGAGYVGLTTAACFAELRHDVWVVDIDEPRIRRLQRGVLPFVEAGLQELVDHNTSAGRLHFTSSYARAIAGSTVAFIAVATPEGRSGEANVSAVRSAARSIARSVSGPLIVANKSTVPVGTGDLVGEIISRQRPRFPVTVVSNPEFLREGSAVADFMHPDRIVVGANAPEAAAVIADLYAPLGAPIIVADLNTSELIKYASNAFLATRVSFINEMARIAERLGADIELVAQGMRLDPRIGAHYLEPGLGYGGSCIPKDVQALANLAKRYGYHPELLNAVIAINNDQRRIVVAKLRSLLPVLRGRVVGLLGLAFKAGTDDLRQAPSISIARELRSAGAHVRGHDPAVQRLPAGVLPGVRLYRDPYSLARGADALVVVTGWPEFRELDLDRIRSSMRRPIVIDGRNIFDPDVMRRSGLLYSAIGRRASSPEVIPASH